MPPPWVWSSLPEDVHRSTWESFTTWVDWLEEAYEPWVRLAPCWPAHEGLLTELRMFWYWHRFVSTLAVNPADGVRWHQELRRSAQAWSELALCRHEPPMPHHQQLRVEDKARRDRFVQEVRMVERHAAAGYGGDGA